LIRSLRVSQGNFSFFSVSNLSARSMPRRKSSVSVEVLCRITCCALNSRTAGSSLDTNGLSAAKYSFNLCRHNRRGKIAIYIRNNADVELATISDQTGVFMLTQPDGQSLPGAGCWFEKRHAH